MPQVDSKRIQTNPCRDLTSSADDDRFTLTDTSLMKIGDTITFYDKDASGCIDFANPIGERTLLGFCPDEAIVVDSTIDMTVVTGTPAICIKNLDDQEVLNDRIACYAQPTTYPYPIAVPITASQYDVPVVGQATHTIQECAQLFEAGDSYQVMCDNGIVITGTVIGNDFGQQNVIIDDNTDLTAETNCKLINTSLTLDEYLKRIKNDITSIPVYHEKLGLGDCDHTAFKVGSNFISGSTRIKIDGNELHLGTCGTLASLDHGTFPGSNDALRFTSLVTGTNGNSIDIEVVSAAGTAVTVTGSWAGGDLQISVNNDTGTATAQQIADAINADPSASRYVLVQYGGDGTGAPVPALVPTPLAGGLDDWTGQYCEIEQIAGNAISGTGYRWISMHIDPDDPNALSEPPRTSECVYSHYDKSA